MKMPPNPELMKAMQELRRSSAARPHANKKKYDRTKAKKNWRKDF